MELERHGGDDPPEHGVVWGDRRRERGKALWTSLPLVSRAPATCHPEP